MWWAWLRWAAAAPVTQRWRFQSQVQVLVVSERRTDPQPAAVFVAWLVLLVQTKLLFWGVKGDIKSVLRTHDRYLFFFHSDCLSMFPSDPSFSTDAPQPSKLSRKVWITRIFFDLVVIYIEYEVITELFSAWINWLFQKKCNEIVENFSFFFLQGTLMSLLIRASTYQKKLIIFLTLITLL